MRTVGLILLLLVSPSLAAPRKSKGIHFIATSEKAVEIAKTRGRLIFLTVTVDHDNECRAVMDTRLRDPKLIKLLGQFVCLYANPENEHGTIKVKDKSGKRVHRCSDAPGMECEDHMTLAQHYARGFYGQKPVKTPVHFIISPDEDVLDTIYTGDFESGLHSVPADTLITRLKKQIDKHGRGLTEVQYKKMQEDLTLAKAARARKNWKLTAEALLRVTALNKKVPGVEEAKKKLAEVEKIAHKEFEAAKALADEKKWEEALAALRKVRDDYDGLKASDDAERERANLMGLREVKRLMKSLTLYEKAIAFKDRGRIDIARKNFQKCVRMYPETKYGKLSQKELDGLPPSGPGGR